PVEGVARVVTALVTDGSVFSVVRTKQPIKREQLDTNLKLAEEPGGNGLTYYTIKGDLDSLSNLFFKAARPHDKFQLLILDDKTLVFADPAPMQKFLEDKGKPKELSQPSAAPPTGSAPGSSPGTTPGSSPMTGSPGSSPATGSPGSSPAT